MLLTLSSLGYVKQNPKNAFYSASIKVFELGSEVLKRFNFTELAHPFLVELSEKCGETINLGILDGVDMIYVDKIDSKHHLRFDEPVGFRTKAYYSAFGKSCLAFLSKEERAWLFSQHAIIPCTPKSLKTVDAIEKSLQRVREQGYAVDNEEVIVGVRCVGAPLFDQNGQVIAGISIAGPTSRIKKTNIPHLANLVMEAAASISKVLKEGRNLSDK